MRSRTFLSVVFVVVIALLCFASKPSRQDFDNELTGILREAVGNARFDGKQDLLSNVVALGCRVRIDECLAIIKRTYAISTTDFVLFTRSRASGPGADIECWGLMRQFTCTAAMSVPTVKAALEKIW